jgi:hypothetical protein
MVDPILIEQVLINLIKNAGEAIAQAERPAGKRLVGGPILQTIGWVAASRLEARVIPRGANEWQILRNFNNPSSISIMFDRFNCVYRVLSSPKK